MSTNHTPNYQLSQWERSDRIQMEDFNADNAKIDAALAQLQATALRIHTGGYMGTGTQSHTIELPFKPQFFYLQKGVNDETRLMIFGENTVRVQQLNNVAISTQNGQGSRIYFEENGIRIRALDTLTDTEKGISAMNEKGVRYYYVSLG
ncbi:MAG: hypothetical protein HFF46_06995 [Lawsonibacter sp.]|jgi:hypothetical protein|nr:hypothetical protein [Lawsonibacter sp.]